MYRRTRLDPNTFNGANDAPVTQGQMREFMRVLRDWSESLPFARVGFQVSGLSAYVDVPLGDSIITWEQVISDSSTWTKMDKNEDNLTEFTVPPGEGGMYSISWALNCLVVDVGEDLFGPVNDVQSWEVPPDVISVGIECVGATGQGTNFGVGGQGALIAGTLAVTPGDFYDVYVPGSDAWPGAVADRMADSTSALVAATVVARLGSPLPVILSTRRSSVPVVVVAATLAP